MTAVQTSFRYPWPYSTPFLLLSTASGGIAATFFVVTGISAIPNFQAIIFLGLGCFLLFQILYIGYNFFSMFPTKITVADHKVTFAFISTLKHEIPVAEIHALVDTKAERRKSRFDILLCSTTTPSTIGISRNLIGLSEFIELIGKENPSCRISSTLIQRAA